MAAADATLYGDTLADSRPLELVTDFGSQFVNDLLTYFPRYGYQTPHHDTVL